MGARLIRLPRFQPNPILAEQLRLVLHNLPVALAGIWATAGLVTLALYDGVPLLLPWIIAHSLVAGLGMVYFYCYPDFNEQQAQRVAREVMLVVTLCGILWGALPHIAFDHPGIIAPVMILGAIAGLIGGSVSLLAVPFHLIFLITVLPALFIRLYQENNAEYFALGIASLIYGAATLYFARAAERATLAAIHLRFENTGLVQQLQREFVATRAAHDEAQAANAAKSRFLAATSHDLRQTVQAIHLFMEAITQSTLSASQLKIVSNAKLAVKATHDILNTLLDFSKIEAGAIKPMPRVFQLQPLLNNLEKELANEANGNNLVYRNRETRLAVEADSILTTLILRNLICNAIRYTQNGGLLVGCRSRGQHVVVEIWDTGIGIPATQFEEIFREFYQLESPHRQGLGLGLAIVAGLVKTMGGEVKVTLASTLGRGSVFRLWLPKATGEGG